MAPEIMFDNSMGNHAIYDEKCDIWSKILVIKKGLGVILHELVYH